MSTRTVIKKGLGANRLNNLKIGRKLTLGFGILVFLTLLVILLGYLGSQRAAQKIQRTDEVRVPMALLAARTQADLLRVQSDVRGYLVLGEQEFRDNYEMNRVAFEAGLRGLLAQAPAVSAPDQSNLVLLNDTYQQWLKYPERLFELRDDQLEREPAYAILATDGLRTAGTVLIDTGALIDEQGRQAPSTDNQNLLAEMARYQGSFSAMLGGLRGYVTTRNRTFRGEFDANLALNQIAWDRLSSRRDGLTPRQQTLLDNISSNREAFLKLSDEMFGILEGERWREDLYLFRKEATPLTQNMLQTLEVLTNSQQNQLRADLEQGKTSLNQATAQTLVGGALAVLLGLLLAMVFQSNIAGPVRRLTDVVLQIRGGDLDARTRVESSDEIGALASAFNGMTGRLQETLQQTQREKKRADDLLNVVIPIGVQLAGEKDFNRLLENVLVEAKKFCHAQAGILYLLNPENELQAVIYRDDLADAHLDSAPGAPSAGVAVDVQERIALIDPGTGQSNGRSIAAVVALGGQPANASDIYSSENPAYADLKALDQRRGTRHKSVLTLPLRDSSEMVTGVLQLSNGVDPTTGKVIAFDENLQQMMSSLSALASVALEAYVRERALRQEIQQLRIEIDEVKRQKQVSEIVDSDFFQSLQARARSIRNRARGGAEAEPLAPAEGAA